MDITLPGEGGRSSRYRLVGQPAQPVDRRQVFAHRLCRRACRRRSACHDRSVVEAGGRLGRDDGVPPSSVAARLPHRRGDGHLAARHGFRLGERQGTDPPLDRRGAHRALAPISPRAPAPTIWQPARARTLDDVIAAYEEQFGFIEGLGGKAIMMASRALAAVAKGPDDYVNVYDRILGQASGKVILHWLGDMFDPALEGLLGQPRFRDGARHGRRHHRTPCRQGRGDQDIAARRRQGNRAQEPAAGRRAHVHRRRLQLSRTDRRRRRTGTRTRCSAFSTPSRRSPMQRWRSSPRATAPAMTR